MATKYDDIIKLRGGKASYNIENEKKASGYLSFPMSSLITYYVPY